MGSIGVAAPPNPDRPPPPPRPPALWRSRDFSVFWLVQTLSVAGDSFSYVAIPLLVLHATGSVAHMGLLTALGGAASVVTGIFAGVLVDRVNRRALLVGCDVARAVVYALIPIAWLFAPQVWLIYPVVAIGGVLGMVFKVSYVTAVPRLVAPERITEANGLLSATYAAAGVGGPMLAGVVSGLFGATAAIGIDAATFAASAVGLCFVRLRPCPPAAPAAAGGRETPGTSWRDFLAGAQFLWRHPALRSLTLLLSLLIFMILGLTDVFIYYLKHDLGRTDGTVGTVLAVAAVGTVVAALLVAPARRTLGFGTCWIGANALGGLAVVGVGVSTDVVAVALLVATFTFAVAVGGICSMSLRQEITPDHLLGRVTSAFWTIHSALGPLGAALLTAAVARVGSPTVLVVAGVSCLTIALSGLLTPIRQRRPEHVPLSPAEAA
ncbi:MFS transporter, partial [Micromonospora zhanjiangensis]